MIQIISRQFLLLFFMVLATHLVVSQDVYLYPSDDNIIDPSPRLLSSPGESDQVYDSEEEVTCDVVGCEYCLLKNICHDCLDDHGTNKIKGKCECKLFYEKPSQDGICEPCYIPGCASCETGNDHTCHKCIDPSLEPTDDGECICPDGMHMDEDGTCHSCEILGCDECSKNSDSVCMNCVDQLNTEIIDGKCECLQKNKTINSFGVCTYCLVQGCQSCTWNSLSCHKCRDSTATLTQEGKCICSEGKPLNQDGYCQACAIEYCESCMTGNPNVCQVCENTFIKSSFDSCRCPPGKHEVDDVCVDYRIAGCKNQLGDQCIECLEDQELTLIQGICICSYKYDKPNNEGSCQYCSSPGCLSCMKDKDNYCHQCKDLKALSVDGICKCPSGLFLNSEGVCSQCKVVGCRRCAEDSPQVCEECTDCFNTLHLSESAGQCICPPFKKPSIFGSCEFCFVDGCSSCGINSNICDRCMDEKAEIKDGKCTCPDSQPLKQNGYCPGCSYSQVDVDDYCRECVDFIEGCKRCESTTTCLICIDSQAVVRDGLCICGENQRLNSEGYCECLPQFKETDGFCTKKECNEIFPGCLQCSLSECLKCNDTNNMFLANGQCHCISQYFQPNSLNTCSQCFVIGCSSCFETANGICNKCRDTRSRLEGGKCICSSNEIMSPSGYCTACLVPGCLTCSEESPYICLDCKKTNYMSLNSEGKCVCSSSSYKPSSFGDCTTCYAANCMSCERLNSLRCHICLDPIAYLENGICKCSTGMQFKNGYCEDIVPGCLKVDSSDFTRCQECHPGFTITKDSKCQCPAGLTMNTDHYCSKCNIVGCQRCYPYHENACGVCHESFELKDEKCICKGDNMSPNEANECSECLVKGCVKCHSRDPHSCLQYEQEVSGYSRCSMKNCDECRNYGDEGNMCLDCVQPMFVTEDGICQECQVSNCQTCHSPNICSVCVHSLKLLNGICICSTDYNALYESNSCSTCYIGGCSRCKSTYVCLECQDPRALLIDGYCVCPKGYYIEAITRMCTPCRVAGCSKCSPQNPEICIDCYKQGRLKLINGKCICTSSTNKPSSIGYCNSCLDQNCASCEYGRNKICVFCIDPNAYLQNHNCKCPIGKYFNSHGYCEDIPSGCLSPYTDNFNQCQYCHHGFTKTESNQCKCPEGQLINTDNYCSPCNVPGCQKCFTDQQNICRKCLHGLLLNEGICQCSELHQAPNQDGVCSDCFCQDCLSCSSSDPKNCLIQSLPRVTEVDCTDENCYKCIMEDDEEVCMDCVETMFLESGLCKKCNIPGCEQCFSPTVCQSCDPYSTYPQLNSKGHCQCLYFYQKPNTLGSCSTCYIGGCSKCHSSNTNECHQCFDQRAALKDGRCYCPPGQNFSPQGVCTSSCRVPGCQQCIEGDPYKCQVCSSLTYGVTAEGICNCTSNKPSQLGNCRTCTAKNCISCQYSTTSRCFLCTDPIAYLENGVCFCPGEKIFNSYGYCVDRTPGCLTPTSGDYDSCVTCIYGFIKNDNNKCDCPIGLTINTDHYCSACNVPGCIRCYTENANICNECLPSLNLVNGLCECEGEGQFPSQAGTCIDCDIDGCISCSSEDSSCLTLTLPTFTPSACTNKDCRQCVEEDGQQVCLTCVQSLFLVDGQCKKCDIPGCKNCYGPHTCQECFTGVLVDGVCFYSNYKSVSFYYYKLNEFNSFVPCYVAGCLSCLNSNRYQCLRCVDYRATLTEEGRCQCPQGLYFNPNGYCVPCRIPGCLKCNEENPEICDTCGFSTYMNKNDQCTCTYSSYSHDQFGWCNNYRPSNCLAKRWSGSNSRCYLCKDPKAFIVQDICQCPAGTQFKSEMCQEIGAGCKIPMSSDYSQCSVCHPGFTLDSGTKTCSCSDPSLTFNTDNYCSICNVPGCARCYPEHPHICEQCFDIFVIEDGVCTCEEEGEKPNENNECSACTADDCLSCDSDDATACLVEIFTQSSALQECDEQNCELCSGQDCVKCVEQYYVDEGKCEKCDVLGCLSCYSPNVCKSCMSGLYLSSGKCLCNSYYNKKPNEDNVCYYCYIGGCASCLATSNIICRQCQDERAILQNGRCICPKGQYPSPTGKCHPCRVPGCLKCAEGNPEKCETCNSNGMTLTGDFCNCRYSYQRPNQIGYCESCSVPNCKSCEDYKISRCFICTDPQAYLENGVCLCPPGKIFSSQYCIDIVPGCKTIVSGNPNQCSVCQPGFILDTADKQCKCQDSALSLNSEFYCSPCHVPGCKYCYPEHHNICQKCKENFKRNEDTFLCECQIASQMPDQENQCSNCLAQNCLSCHSVDPYECLKTSSSIVVFTSQLSAACSENCSECYMDEDLQICVSCIEKMFVREGQCKPCHIPGCLLCYSPYVCLSCFTSLHPNSTSNFYLVNGFCECSSVPNSLKPALQSSGIEKCMACYLPGCASCNILSSHSCEYCYDPKATIVKGFCKCPNGQYFSYKGNCEPCRVPGCESCSDSPDTCLVCKSGTTITNEGTCKCLYNNQFVSNFGTCQNCYIRGCFSCLHAQPSTCFRCLDKIAEIVEGQCVCPKGFAMNVDEFCVPCSDDNCLECNKDYASYCIDCDNDYDLILGKCVPKKVSSSSHPKRQPSGYKSNSLSGGVIAGITIGILLVLILVVLLVWRFVQKRKGSREESEGPKVIAEMRTQSDANTIVSNQLFTFKSEGKDGEKKKKKEDFDSDVRINSTKGL